MNHTDRMAPISAAARPKPYLSVLSREAVGVRFLALLAMFPSLTAVGAVQSRYRASYEFEGGLVDESGNGNTLVPHGAAAVVNVGGAAHSGANVLNIPGANNGNANY